MAVASAYLEKFADFEEHLYFRRYCAVSFTHPAMADWTGCMSAIENMSMGQLTRIQALSGWDASRVAFTVPRNYFPKISDDNIAIDGAFVQEAYFAFATAQSSGLDAPLLVVLSPYVRLLNRLLTRIATQLGSPRLEYICPDMDGVFELFETSSFDYMNATRISVRDRLEPSIELVSLTGRNPLKSNLRAELRRVGPGYSIRVEVQTSDGPVRVHLDRFGNYWWYHRSPADITAPLMLIEQLHKSGPVRLDGNRPTSRVMNSSDAD